MLPGYTTVGASSRYSKDWSGEVPTMIGMDTMKMMSAAKDGKLKALYVVGSNPISRYGIDPFVLNAPFVVVQDMFMTETALAADVILPVANAYETSGTFTNTCGDLQMLRKAGDLTTVKSTSRSSFESLNEWVSQSAIWFRSAAACTQTWGSRAEHKPVKRIVIPFGLPRKEWSQSFLRSTRSRSSMRSNDWFPATTFRGSTFSAATTSARSWYKSRRRISLRALNWSYRRTTPFSPRARLAVSRRH